MRRGRIHVIFIMYLFHPAWSSHIQSTTSKYYQVIDSSFSCFYSSDPPATQADCFKNTPFMQCYQILQAFPLPVTMAQTQAGVNTLASSIFPPWSGISPNGAHGYNPCPQRPLKYLPSNLSLPVMGDSDSDMVVLKCKE